MIAYVCTFVALFDFAAKADPYSAHRNIFHTSPVEYHQDEACYKKEKQYLYIRNALKYVQSISRIKRRLAMKKKKKFASSAMKM